LKENEKNACDAFIKIILKIKGIEYRIDEFPEETNRSSQDVEVILTPKDKNEQSPKIAVEHTIVEAHEEQIAYVNQSYDTVEKINQRCQGKLPTNRHFQIIIPPALLVNTSKKDRDQFIEEMSGCIPDIAETLNAEQWSSQLYNGHKVLFTCVGSIAGFNGKIGRMPTRPEKADKEKQNRFRRAIEEKLLKLIKYKEKGFATALLLEDVSFSHSNPGDDLKELIPNQYHSEFQLKIDYVVIFVSNEKKMIVGNVWKEESQLYAEIPDNRRFNRQLWTATY
jgi:hypothetical protein